MLDLAILQALNHLLAAAPWARDKLIPFAGRRARLVLGPLPLEFRIAPDGTFESLGTGEPAVEILLPATAALALLDLGVQHLYRDCLDSAIRAGVDVLVKLGFRRFSATRAGQNFMKYDEAALLNLAPHRHDQKDYIASAREQIQLQEQMLAADREIGAAINDHAWDSALMKGSKNAPGT